MVVFVLDGHLLDVGMWGGNVEATKEGVVGQCLMLSYV